MTDKPAAGPADDVIEVDLRNPFVAALLAWLWPGAGHLYQRRYAKGTLFMVCILTTYFFGLAIADGHSVYASFTREERRWQFLCQAGVGAPAMVAMLQRHRVIVDNQEPLFGGFMAPPRHVNPEGNDQLAGWHRDYHMYFDLGTLYTMIAGLLNALVIYDAFAGPMAPPADEPKRGPPDKNGDKGRKDEDDSATQPEGA